ncbi:MAG: ATP-binding protein [Nanoarchaeota archaeon]
MESNIYAIIGGPGRGKSTTLKELGKLGFDIVEEAAEQIKKEQLALPNPILPETNFLGFQRLVITRQVDLESRINGKITFTDRGRPDNLAYCRMKGVEVPYDMQKAVDEGTYHGIFSLSRLQVYVQTDIRTESESEADVMHGLIESVYQERGYPVIQVPLLEAPERAKWIVNNMRGEQNGWML